MNTLLSCTHWGLYAACADKARALRHEDVPNTRWQMIFIRQGQLNIYARDENDSALQSLDEGECNLLFIPDTDVPSYELRPYENSAPAEMIAISLCPTWLQKYCSDEALRTKYKIEQRTKMCMASLCNHTISEAMTQYLSDMLRTCETAANLQMRDKIRCEAHVVLLITELIELLQKNDAPCPINGCKLKAHHYEKIRHAEMLIRASVKESCSLLSLARRVGTNECTLKKGFKEVYGTTVFNYLRDLRMARASELLEKGNLSVGEIAEEVGYKNHSNFTVAFKRKYKATPRTIKTDMPPEN